MRLSKNRALGETNSALVAQIRKIVSNIFKVIPAHKTFGWDGWTEGGEGAYWKVLNSDTNAKIGGTIYVPQTRADWQIFTITYSSVLNITDNGRIYAGAATHGEATSLTNIFNNIVFNIAHGAANNYVYKYTTVFSASKDDLIRVEWDKNNDAGAGDLVFWGFYLYHA